MVGGLPGEDQYQYRNYTRDELRKFVSRYPDLCVECFECDGEGTVWFEMRWVDCWRCHTVGKVPFLPLLVRHLLEARA